MSSNYGALSTQDDDDDDDQEQQQSRGANHESTPERSPLHRRSKSDDQHLRLSPFDHEQKRKTVGDNSTGAGGGGLIDGMKKSVSERNLDLSRTFSESVQTLERLAKSNFVLSESACNASEDRIHQFSAAGTATIASEVINISKNLIGGGVLSLSGGMALYANTPTAALSAVYWVSGLGAVFGYFCLLIAKSCELSLSATYRECWERTVGHHGGLFVAIINTLDPLLGIFANASILSQSLQLLLRGIDIELTVIECLFLITVFGLLPLCLMKNLSALAPFSALGMAAVLCALGCMTVRYLDGSYLQGGIYYDDISYRHRPSFAGTAGQGHDNDDDKASNRPFSIDALPFVCMVYTSFDMHYNAPRFYAELKDASIPRFAQVVTYSFGITAVIYFLIAIVGFLTFGTNSDSYILNNYSPKDSLATVSRLAIGLCALVSYPLNFIGVRDNCLDILGLTDEFNTDAKLNVFTLLLLTTLTITSCFVTDLGLINSVGGGTTVTFLCFLFPAMMFQGGLKKHSLNTGVPVTARENQELALVMIFMVVGVVLGIAGVWISIAIA